MVIPYILQLIRSVRPINKTEVKELKRRVRDIIQPGRGLGHVDRHGQRKMERAREGRHGREVKMDKKEDKEEESVDGGVGGSECLECAGGS